jgi:YVTN family beta-propeller protein
VVYEVSRNYWWICPIYSSDRICRYLHGESASNKFLYFIFNRFANTRHVSHVRQSPLRTLRDVPLSGGATRFDYQSFDSNSGRRYIAHRGDGAITVFDADKEAVIGDDKNLPRVHGVIAVPELHRIYASATGSNELAVIDDGTLQVVARVPAGDYPVAVTISTVHGLKWHLIAVSESC